MGERLGNAAAISESCLLGIAADTQNLFSLTLAYFLCLASFLLTYIGKLNNLYVSIERVTEERMGHSNGCDFR